MDNNDDVKTSLERDGVEPTKEKSQTKEDESEEQNFDLIENHERERLITMNNLLDSRIGSFNNLTNLLIGNRIDDENSIDLGMHSVLEV